MKILHTSDWHLGRQLYARKRYDEYEAFLAWLSDRIARERVETLIVAGDVFDTTAPTHRAQQLYYRFLQRTVGSTCRHIVIIGGNHDSPSLLDAPKELLEALNVHVIGAACADPEGEVLVLRNANDVPELIVCAVPYLRDRDVRTVDAGETIEDREKKLLAGIRSHYAAAGEIAERRRAELGTDIPLIVTGHLFAAGGQTVDGDGVRELYIGTLAHVTTGVFPASADYVALGHLHIPQKAGGKTTIRYSGSPLPMGFGEATRPKSVCLVEFTGRAADVRTMEVPVFQALERITGDWDTIARRIGELRTAESHAWLEVIYDGAQIIGDLRERLEAAVDGSHLELLGIRNNRLMPRALGPAQAGETLDDLTPDDVFVRCLDANAVPDEQRQELIATYREAARSVLEDDAQAE